METKDKSSKTEEIKEVTIQDMRSSASAVAKYITAAILLAFLALTSNNNGAVVIGSVLSTGLFGLGVYVYCSLLIERTQYQTFHLKNKT